MRGGISRKYQNMFHLFPLAGVLLAVDPDTRIAATTTRSVQALTIMSTSHPADLCRRRIRHEPSRHSGAHDVQGFAIVVGVCGVVVALSYLVLRRFRILP
jgi:hypothetical protein